MSMADIRKQYGVPAKRGGRVAYHDLADEPCYGTIRCSRAGYLLIQLDGDSQSRAFHPTDKLEYLNDCPVSNAEKIVEATQQHWTRSHDTQETCRA